MFSSSHCPRSTGDVRFGYDVTVRMLAWPSSPPRVPSAKRRRAGSGCRRRSGSRSAAPAARSRTCSRRSAARRRCGSSRSWLSTNSCVSCSHRVAQVLVELRIQRRRRARRRRSLLSSSHWLAKLSTSACERGSREHAPHLLLEHGRIAQRSAHRRVQQLVVRNAAPQEERQPRREVEIAEAIRRRRRRRPAGSRSMRNRKLGAARIRSSPRWMPASKPPSARPAR